MTNEVSNKLLDAAIQAAKNSYSPYSDFPVGAAVLTPSGKIYAGANVENASYGATICAERVAVFKAISEGEDKILALAVYSSAADYAYPCGMCLQVLSEFSEDIPVVIAGNSGQKNFKLSELLPHRFGK